MLGGDLGEAQRLGLTDGLPVDGEARGQAHALIVPRRLRVPLLAGEVDPEGGGDQGGRELQPGRALDLLRKLAADRIGYVDLAALEHGKPRRLLGDDPEDQPLDVRRLAPVALVRLEHHLHAGVEGHELVGPGADGGLLEPVLADLLHVGFRHDPGGAGRRRRKERHEVGPGLAQLDADPQRVDDLDARNLLLEELGRGAAIALEGELDVLGGHRLAVVEDDVAAQGELVGEPVRRHRPGLGQRWRRGIAGHGLQQRIVQRIEHQHAGDDAGMLAGIEPGRCDRNVHRPGHLAFGSAGRPRGRRRQEESQGEHDDGGADPGRISHGILLGKVAAISPRPFQSVNRLSASARDAGKQGGRAIGHRLRFIASSKCTSLRPMSESLKLGIAGLGTVGTGLLQLLREHGPRLAQSLGRPIEVAGVSARTRDKKRGVPLEGLKWFDAPEESGRGPWDRRIRRADRRRRRRAQGARWRRR